MGKVLLFLLSLGYIASGLYLYDLAEQKQEAYEVFAELDYVYADVVQLDDGTEHVYEDGYECSIGAGSVVMPIGFVRHIGNQDLWLYKVMTDGLADTEWECGHRAFYINEYKSIMDVAIDLDKVSRDMHEVAEIIGSAQEER